MTEAALGRLAPRDGQPTMKAVVTLGNGGYDQLLYCDVARPTPGPADVLVEVRAAGMNNTEINTRLGWYSTTVRKSTADAAANEQSAATRKADGGWNAATPFPFIQGTDCCGIVVEVGAEANRHLLGQRILVRACMRPDGFTSPENIWMASDLTVPLPSSSRSRQPRCFRCNATGPMPNLPPFPAPTAPPKT